MNYRCSKLRPTVFGSLFFACLASFALVAQSSQFQSSTESKPSENLHGVISRQPLKPAIRGRTDRLIFSPDGKYLLVQSESGIFLFSTRPLKPVLHIDADYMYPVRFSRDSQSLYGVSLALRRVRWRVPDGGLISFGELQVPDGCLAGDLSPDGESFVCHRTDFSFRRYNLDSGHETFAEASRAFFTQTAIVPLSVPPSNLIATAFGLVAMRSMQIYANHNLYPEKFSFSPDGNLVAMFSAWDISLWNTSTKRKVGTPGALNKLHRPNLCFLDNDRILSTADGQPAEVFSLASGKIVTRPAFEASSAALASDSRYLILSEANLSRRRLFDLTSDHLVDLPENVALDIRENIVALLDAVGKLSLLRIGEDSPYAMSFVPLEIAPPRFAASASPSLDLFAYGFGQESGLYRTDTGQRVFSLEYSSEQAVPDSSGAYFTKFAKNATSKQEVMQAKLSGKTLAPVWDTESIVRGSPAAFFEYVPQGPRQNVPEVLLDGKIPFQLLAREPGTGRVLWEKKFINVHPIAFVDPQGYRLILAWEAGTEGARSAAKRCADAWPIFRKAKPTSNDTLFEVLDSTDGNTIGGVLVRTGSGPLSFDAVSSVGPMLMIAKEEGRTTLYSLQDGEIKARLNGGYPVASSAAQLLALIESGNRLGIYDLLTGQKLDQQQFAQPITYMHFSQEGRRILVLTGWQTVYVLDLAEAIKVKGK